jgi:hypothetical protein
VGEWISVEDRLPEPVIDLGGTEFSEDVLVWDGEGIYINFVIYPHGLYGGSVAARFTSDNLTDNLVTHWMPKPEPPERAR